MRVCRARQLPACTGLPSYSAYSVYYPHTTHVRSQHPPRINYLNVAPMSRSLAKNFRGCPWSECWRRGCWCSGTPRLMVLVLLHYCSVQLSACCVHAACYQLWSALQLLVYVPTSCRLQQCRIWSAALQSACSTDCSTEAWWAGLLINLQFWSLQLGRGDRES